MEIILARLRFENLHKAAADPADFEVRLDRQAPDFAVCGGIKMQRSASHQTAIFNSYHEIADIFGHLEFAARKHDSALCVGVDELEQRRNIGERGGTDFRHGRK